MTTLATVIARGTLAARPAAASAGRIYFDTTNSILYRDNGASWDSIEGSGGLTNPMTTVGDIIIGGASGAPTRLAAGATSGHVLTSNGSGAAPSYQAAGGSSGFTYPIDTVALDGTYGDEFTDASLNARWTRHVQGSGEETYQQGAGGSALRTTYATAAASRYIYQTAPNGTNETWECSHAFWSETTGQMFALLMVDASGNGVAAIMYDNVRGLILANIAAHGYSSVLSAPTYADAFVRAGQRCWLRLRKASGVYYASFSLNGETYSPEASGTPSAFTPARVGIGRVLGTHATYNVVDWYRFNKTA